MNQCHRDDIERIIPNYYALANTLSNKITTLDIESAKILRSINRINGALEVQPYHISQLEEASDRFTTSLKGFTPDNHIPD